MSDEYCFAEHCRHRHWQPGSMPTHRKGDTCPKEYTPSTEEVRTDYIMAYTERQSSQLLAGLAFDRWYQAELRRAKAEALRQAAEELDHSTDADVNNFIGRPRPTHSHTDRYADVRWLEHRADQIEKEATNDHP